MNQIGAEPRPGPRKRGLGMGLSALLGNAADLAGAEGVRMVPIEFLRPAARQRRSPATISYCSSSLATRRTSSGCITPLARIESASAASSASAK